MRVCCRLTKKAEPPPTRDVNRDSGTDSANGGWLRRLVRCGGFKFEVRQLGRGCPPDISVPTQAPSSCGVGFASKQKCLFLCKLLLVNIMFCRTSNLKLHVMVMFFVARQISGEQSCEKHTTQTVW